MEAAGHKLRFFFSFFLKLKLNKHEQSAAQTGLILLASQHYIQCLQTAQLLEGLCAGEVCATLCWFKFSKLVSSQNE